MDTSSITDAASAPSRAARAHPVRVGIAGASGFAGQELLRWLAGHPRVRVTAAMSSSPDGPARTLPALSRIWDGAIEPFSAEKLADRSDVVFLALPEEAAAAIAPILVGRGIRVIDLSGAFRLRDAASREKWYPATKLGSLKPVYGLTERNYAEIGAASSLRTRAATPPPRCLHSSRWPRPDCWQATS